MKQTCESGGPGREDLDKPRAFKQPIPNALAKYFAPQDSTKRNQSFVDSLAQEYIPLNISRYAIIRR